MSKQYQIISDSSCDFTPEMAAQYNVNVVPFYVSFDKEHYYKEIEEIVARENVLRAEISKIIEEIEG